ncbi:MAG: DUF4435 domain-containing protein [Christensenellales bacterium]|jgi:hypothetical protein
MMDGVKEKFNRALSGEYKHISEILFKLNTYRSDRTIRYFCIVEGKTDELFYSCILPAKLKRAKTVYLYNANAGGKEKVMRTFLFCRKKLPKEMKKYLFIVDHDYDGMDAGRYGLSEQDTEHITMTPCYSIENYYLMYDNPRMIFRELGLNPTQRDLDDFNRAAYEFTREIGEYSAYKRTAMLLRRAPEAKYKESQMFNGSTPGYIDRKKLKAQVKILKEFFHTEEDKEIYFESYRMLRNQPHYMKGKLLFNFLRNYLYWQHQAVFNIEPDKLYKRITSKLQVELDIRFGA